VRSSSNLQPRSSSQAAGRTGLSAEAADGLVDYFRCISGEHPNWQEYREAMRIPGQVANPNHPDSLGSDRDWWIPGRRCRATGWLGCCEDDIGPHGTLKQTVAGWDG
jgi:hypothetical protein